MPAFLTITVMPLTYSIANGVVAGLVSHAIIELCALPLAWHTPAKTTGQLTEPLNDTQSSNGGAAAARAAALAADSAAASPHAMVREPARRSGSFGGLSSLGGRASPQPSPYASPLPPGAALRGVKVGVYPDPGL